MSLNNQGRIQLERSGPWIGVAGLFVLLWIAIASSQFAPWWGVLLYVVALIPGAVLVARWARTHPRRAAWVPLGSLAVWAIITAVGLSFWGWKADADTSTSTTRVLAAQCATKFDDLRQTMGENGNPGQPGTPLAVKWDAVATQTTALSKRAKVTDCPTVLDTANNQVAGIDRLVGIVDQFDMEQTLKTVEAEVVEPWSQKVSTLPTKLRRAVDALRVHAPLSNRDLTTEFAIVEGTDPLDATAVTDSLEGLRKAALGNDHFSQCTQALKVIASYHLAEG